MGIMLIHFTLSTAQQQNLFFRFNSPLFLLFSLQFSNKQNSTTSTTIRNHYFIYLFIHNFEYFSIALSLKALKTFISPKKQKKFEREKNVLYNLMLFFTCLREILILFTFGGEFFPLFLDNN